MMNNNNMIITIDRDPNVGTERKNVTDKNLHLSSINLTFIIITFSYAMLPIPTVALIF